MPPSAWVQRFAGLIKAQGTVLDVACGSGRHVHLLRSLGFQVTAVDREATLLASLQDASETVRADLEADPWPLPGRRFDAVVVTNYLWRPLFPALRSALSDDGVLIYETFGDGQQTVGRPSRPEFLLRPGELLAAADGLRVVAYENGFLDTPARFVQRIVAVRERSAGNIPPRYPLHPAG